MSQSTQTQINDISSRAQQNAKQTADQTNKALKNGASDLKSTLNNQSADGNLGNKVEDVGEKAKAEAASIVEDVKDLIGKSYTLATDIAGETINTAKSYAGLSRKKADEVSSDVQGSADKAAKDHNIGQSGNAKDRLVQEAREVINSATHLVGNTLGQAREYALGAGQKAEATATGGDSAQNANFQNASEEAKAKSNSIYNHAQHVATNVYDQGLATVNNLRQDERVKGVEDTLYKNVEAARKVGEDAYNKVVGKAEQTKQQVK